MNQVNYRYQSGSSWAAGSVMNSYELLMEEITDLLSPRSVVQTVVGDDEFDTDAKENSCRRHLGVQLIRTVDQGHNMNHRLPGVYFRLCLGVERAIRRLAKLTQMQRPPVLRTARVTSYVHAGTISLQLIAIYAVITHQKHFCRSLKWMRRKKVI